METRTASFAVLLRHYRGRAGLTQEELAARTGLSVRGLSDLERGLITRPRAATLHLLAQALRLAAADRAALEAAAQRPGHGVPPPPGHGVPPAPGIEEAHSAAVPAPLTPLIGRDDVVATVCGLLRQPQTRLLTLTGVGGVGKTRLALAAAAAVATAFPDGVAFVSLAALREPAWVLATIAQALGVREQGGRPLAATVGSYLRTRRLLLVLDNFEHLLAAAPVVTELLAVSAGVVVLATSRAALRLRAEQQFAVPPLAVPTSASAARYAQRLDEVAGYAAVRLFVERAQALQPSFALTQANAGAVAAICARLDGLPLAIELAAALVRLFTPQALLARLSNRLRVLIGGAHDAPQRQQTLRETIAWSYALLDEPMRMLFRRLSVFAGGCTVAAVEAVCTQVAAWQPENDVLATLAALVDQSLLLVDEDADGEPRFGMLETVREYASESLDAVGETSTQRRAHALYYLALAEEAAPHLTGPTQVVWLTRLGREHDNLRAALRWAVESEQADAALRLAAALWRFWWYCSHQSEGRRWLDEVLARGAAAPPTIRAYALQGAGQLAINQGDLERATALSNESLALFQSVEDRRGVALALSNLGEVARELGDYEHATTLFEESLALYQQWGDEQGIAETLHALGQVPLWQGDYARAEQRFAEGLALARRAGNKMTIASYQRDLGLLAYFQTDVARARAAIAESLVLFDDLGDKTGVTGCVIIVAGIAGASGHLERAALLLGAAEAFGEAVGMQLPPPARATYDAAVAGLRSTLGDEAFMAAWAAGRALSPEETIDCALREAQIS